MAFKRRCPIVPGAGEEPDTIFVTEQAETITDLCICALLNRFTTIVMTSVRACFCIISNDTDSHHLDGPHSQDSHVFRQP